MFGIDAKNVLTSLILAALAGTCVTGTGCKAILNDKGECGFEISTKWVLIHETSETHSESTAEVVIPSVTSLFVGPPAGEEQPKAEEGEGEADVTLNQNTTTTSNVSVVPTGSVGVPPGSVQPQ